jgi:cob(I)alamin adenosyltransferase
MKTIDKYTMISTKQGDQGTSRNYSNDVLLKTDLLFDVLGTTDELSSMLGLAYHYSDLKEDIKTIQLDLQHINSLLATRVDDKHYANLVPITEEDIYRLESLEQHLLDTCQVERRFVLPGSESSLEGAYLDVARSISRRVERLAIAFVKEQNRSDLHQVLQYLNRLSDVLFIMARSRDKK